MGVEHMNKAKEESGLAHIYEGCDYTPMIQHAFQLFVYGDYRNVRISSFAELARICRCKKETIVRYAKRDNWPLKAQKLAEANYQLPVGSVTAFAEQPLHVIKLETELAEIWEKIDAEPMMIQISKNIGSAKEPHIVEYEDLNPKREKLWNKMERLFDKIQRVTGAAGISEAQSKRIVKMATVKAELEAQDLHEAEKAARIAAQNPEERTAKGVVLS